MSIKKCPKCGLTNFAAAEFCKKCNESLPEVSNEISIQKTSSTPKPNRNYLLLAMLGIIGFVLVAVVSYPVITRKKPVVEAQSSQPQSSFIESITPKALESKPVLSDKNREAAKAALNAIGEINSVSSVGANYPQFTSTLQSAKIKYDAAMRDYKPSNVEENEVQKLLVEAFICYVDAKEAWGEFIEDGDKYNFLTPSSYSKIPEYSREYKFEKSSNGEYYRDEVLRVILAAGDKKFEVAENRIK